MPKYWFLFCTLHIRGRSKKRVHPVCQNGRSIAIAETQRKPRPREKWGATCAAAAARARPEPTAALPAAANVPAAATRVCNDDAPASRGSSPSGLPRRAARRGAWFQWGTDALPIGWRICNAAPNDDSRCPVRPSRRLRGANRQHEQRLHRARRCRVAPGPDIHDVDNACCEEAAHHQDAHSRGA